VVEVSPDASTKTNAGVVPPAEAVRASASGAEIRAGGAAQVEVRVEIAEGYHVNANPPTHDYLRPTKVELVAEQGITAGEPAYPRAVNKKFAFDPQPLAVYEKEAIIKLPLRAAGDAAKGARALRVKVTAQPCDDKTCYPPRTVETSLQLTIK
jgi:DsbC/DsbD-like thiol-disulfide interchange protein